MHGSKNKQMPHHQVSIPTEFMTLQGLSISQNRTDRNASLFHRTERMV